MKTLTPLILLTAVNALLFAGSFFRDAWATNPEILRGKGLEIIDDEGRVRASLSLLPPDPAVKMPDGTTGYPETVLLRLINSQGRPNIKIAATEDGAGLLVAGETDPAYVQILADKVGPSLKLSDKDGHEQILKPL